MQVESAELAEIASLLQRHGFIVERIAESPEYKTPDLLAVQAESRVVIEVKSKEREEQLFELMRKPKGSTGYYRGNSIETALRRGYRQLHEWPGLKPRDHLLIWYWTAASPAANLAAGTLKTLLFGLETLEGYTDPEETYYQKRCFYFHHNFFQRHRALSGVVVENRGKLELCVNSFSPEYPGFRSSSLYELFASKGQVVDPFVSEQRGECFVLDSAHPRKDVNKSVRLLREKYRLGRPTIYHFFLVNNSLD